jgi:GNAT superfamily N-acetyltransferase
MNASDPFITDRTVDLQLRDGTPIRIRPIVPEDSDRLAEGLEELSPESRYLRFLRPIDRLSADELSYLTNIDYDNHFAWVALDTSFAEPRGIGVARYARLDGAVAEAAVVVLDPYQHRGLGGILLRLVAETAYEHEVRTFRAWVAPGNAIIMRLVEEWNLSRRIEDGTVVVDVPLPLPTASLENSSLYHTLREVAAGRIHLQPPTQAKGESSL